MSATLAFTLRRAKACREDSAPVCRTRFPHMRAGARFEPHRSGRTGFAWRPRARRGIGRIPLMSRPSRPAPQPPRIRSQRGERGRSMVSPGSSLGGAWPNNTVFHPHRPAVEADAGASRFRCRSRDTRPTSRAGLIFAGAGGILPRPRLGVVASAFEAGPVLRGSRGGRRAGSRLNLGIGARRRQLHRIGTGVPAPWRRRWIGRL